MNQRMCISCRKRDDKSNLVRLEKINGSVALSDKKNDNSRGIYLCCDKNCIDKAQKSNLITKIFKVEIPAELFSQINQYVERKANGK